MNEFTIKKFQDYQLNDEALYKQFLFHWEYSQYQEALDLLKNNASLDTKQFSASAFNIIGTALTYLQTNYFYNVESMLAENLDAFNLAIYRFANENMYDSFKQYYINNFVLYNDNYYMCIQDSYGNLPIDTNYWVLIGLKGQKGAAGTGLNLKYSWSSTVQYVQYDVVYLEGKLYVALRDNINKNPVSTPEDWELFMTVPRTGMTISETPPTDPYIGQIWCEFI